MEHLSRVSRVSRVHKALERSAMCYEPLECSRLVRTAEVVYISILVLFISTTLFYIQKVNIQQLILMMRKARIRLQFDEDNFSQTMLESDLSKCSLLYVSKNYAIKKSPKTFAKDPPTCH
jgi:hypothetical protein